MCIREKKEASLGQINVKVRHQRSPHAMKFEGRSQEETERQQRCARSKAWNLAKHIYKLTEKDKITFYSPSEKWVLPVASTKEPKERDFVVDPGARVHMVSKKDLNSAELETMWISRNPTTVMTANGEVQNRRSDGVCQAIGLVRQSYASRSSFLGKLCEDHGKTYHWISCQKPHLTKKRAREFIAVYQTMYHLWFLESQ